MDFDIISNWNSFFGIIFLQMTPFANSMMHVFSETLKKFKQVLTKLDKIEQELQIENTVCSGLNLKSENEI